MLRTLFRSYTTCRRSIAGTAGAVDFERHNVDLMASYQSPIRRRYTLYGHDAIHNLSASPFHDLRFYLKAVA